MLTTHVSAAYLLSERDAVVVASGRSGGQAEMGPGSGRRHFVNGRSAVVKALLVAAALSACPLPAVDAQEADSGKAEKSSATDYQAATTSDPSIPSEDLILLLRPLAQDELKVEADAWLGLLKAKTTEISQAELQIKRQREQKEKDSADDTSAPSDEAKEQLVQLRSDQTGIVERTNAVLAAVRDKGGETTDQETYIKAVSGLASATGDAQSLTTYITGWLKSPEGGILLLRRLGIAAGILFIAWLLARFAGHAAGRAVSMHSGISDLLKEFARKMAGRVVMLVGALIALSSLGVEIGPMLAAIGAGGFILAFALQESIGNFAAGMMIMLYRPFDTGNFVDVDGVAGTVQQVTLVSTHLKTPDNKLVILPNSKVLSGVITNANGSATRRVDLVFGIGYSDDMGQAITTLEQLVSEHPLVLKDPAPVVKVNELADSSVNLICRPWVKASDYWTVYWDMMRNVKERFDAQGISIPFPQRDVHVYPSDAGGNGTDRQLTTANR